MKENKGHHIIYKVKDILAKKNNNSKNIISKLKPVLQIEPP